MSLRCKSVFPGVGFGGEVAALRAHHAEALPGGRFHHKPGLDRADAPRAELLEPAYLRLDVVGLDVEVHAALVLHPLDLEVRLIGGGIQSAVQRVRRGTRPHREAERRGPEACGSVQIIRAAVDDEASEATLVHGLILCRAAEVLLTQSTDSNGDRKSTRL